MNKAKIDRITFTSASHPKSNGEKNEIMIGMSTFF